MLAGREKQKILNFWETCTVAPPLEAMMPEIAYPIYYTIYSQLHRFSCFDTHNYDLN